MELNIQDWKEFKLNAIMKIINGKGITDDEISENTGFLPAIQGGENNIGILGYIDEKYCKNNNYIIIKEPCLTVARVGTAGYVSYHEKCVIGDKAKALLFKDKKISTPYKYMFMCTILNKNRYKYSYGRGLVTEIYMNEYLKLPILRNSNGTPLIDENKTYSAEGYIPDWQFMEEYIKSLHHKPITSNVKTGKIKELDINNWEEFSITDIFYVKYGINMELTTCEETTSDDPNGIAFVARTAENNGVSAYVKKIKDKFPQPAGTITVAGGGSVLSTFVQYRPFYSGRDLYLLIPKEEINLKIKIFICTVLYANQYRYSYGRQANKTLPSLILKLPIQRDNNGSPIIDDKHNYSEKGYIPDWQFMEDYINSLPYSDRI